ncbi:lipoate--protein ligase family protein [Bifidobacterium primatium]|uniref:lipoate--protein ligase family protein n=1 Tax=Bifidobacterium primatium TaxID=2045438 RepID=UPI001FAFD178|nr:biotin/lipoate A/B protein ligase family protein [Bifidobacterium primatium]
MIGRGLCKTPRGKLVAVTVRIEGDGTGPDRIIEAHLDGDFLIDTVDDTTDAHGASESDRTLLTAIERIIVSAGTDVDGTMLLASVEAVIAAHPNARLVGTTADAIVTAALRAIANASADIAPAGGGCRQRRPGAAGHPKPADTKPSAGVSGTDTSIDSGPANPNPHGEQHNDLTQRWSTLTPCVDVVIDAEPYNPAMQMALDEVIARRVAAGRMPPTLRFWRWGSPAVIIGAYQSVRNEVDEHAAAAAGFTVVRRMTGGGAMFVRPDDTITYSLYVPAGFTAGLTAGESYRLCDDWAFKALHAIGIPAVPQPLNDIATSDGGKIGGAAQRRFPAPRQVPGHDEHSMEHPDRSVSLQRPVAGEKGSAVTSGLGCILHHVTMAYDIDAELMTHVLHISKEKLVDKAVSSAKKRVTPLRTLTALSREAVVESMRDHALADIPSSRPSVLSADVIDEARSLAVGKYETREWTYRIP